MSTAAVFGCTLLGVDAVLVRVEVDVRPGLPVLSIVGLPDRAVAESARRIRAALSNSGFRLPPRRVTVNLAPADLPKHGAGLDLPIGAALLAAAGHVPAERFRDLGFWGQLSLSGDVLGATGSLPAAMCFRRAGLRAVVAAREDAAAAGLAGIEVHHARRLSDLAAQSWPGSCEGPAAGPDRAAEQMADQSADQAPKTARAEETEQLYLSIRGLQGPKRALLLAAAGGHSLVLLGPPGAGKSILARALHALLPPLSRPEAVDVARIASAAGGSLAGTGALPVLRPLRAPSSASGQRAMFGGGLPPVAGEVTLAHAGILVLDELPLFKPEILAGVARALDAGSVSFTYHMRDVTFPAAFQLAATANLCPCGRTGSLEGGCRCTPAVRRRHYRRMSAQLLDRVDLHLEVAGAETRDLLSTPPAARSCPGGLTALQEARRAVRVARAVQEGRYGEGVTNATARQEPFDAHSEATPGAIDLLSQARSQLGLSARGCLRVLRVARTAADLDGSREVRPAHIAEALAYRWRVPDA